MMTEKAKEQARKAKRSAKRLSALRRRGIVGND